MGKIIKRITDYDYDNNVKTEVEVFEMHDDNKDDLVNISFREQNKKGEWKPTAGHYININLLRYICNA